MPAKLDVYIGSRHVNTVYVDDDLPAKDVRKSLINHDGLPSTISVYKYHPTRYAYCDVARASHPEEL